MDHRYIYMFFPQQPGPERIDTFGWSRQMGGVMVLDLSLDDIGDADLWNRTVREHMESGRKCHEAVCEDLQCCLQDRRGWEGPP